MSYVYISFDLSIYKPIVLNISIYTCILMHIMCATIVWMWSLTSILSRSQFFLKRIVFYLIEWITCQLGSLNDRLQVIRTSTSCGAGAQKWSSYCGLLLLSLGPRAPDETRKDRLVIHISGASHCESVDLMIGCEDLWLWRSFFQNRKHGTGRSKSSEWSCKLPCAHKFGGCEARSSAVHIGMCELRFWRLRDLCIEPFDTWRQFGLPWSAEDQEGSEGSVGSWEAGHLCFSSRFERGYRIKRI